MSKIFYPGYKQYTENKISDGSRATNDKTMISIYCCDSNS